MHPIPDESSSCLYLQKQLEAFWLFLFAENVKNDSYVIARPFLFVYKDDVITEQGKNFIDFILSEEGQNVVEENGFISVN